MTLAKGMETPKKKISPRTPAQIEIEDSKSTDRYGIVVFSHLRWGFVWQRPQQFLSRFAKKHPILFVEEPFFDLAEGKEPRVDMHRGRRSGVRRRDMRRPCCRRHSRMWDRRRCSRGMLLSHP